MFIFIFAGWSGQLAFALPLTGSVEQYDATKHWMPTQRMPLGEWREKIVPRLKSGVTWGENLLPQEGTDVVWVHVPDWLAGHWHIERARFYLDRNGAAAPEAVNREDDVFGWQQDRLGGYWTVLRSPITNVTESDDSFSRFIHYQQSGLNKSSVQFDLESDNLEVRVSKKSNRVVSVRKRHDVYAWLIVAGNSGAALASNQASFAGASVQANDHVQFVDERGRIDENSSGTVKSKPTRVALFERIDVAADGFKARESFKAWLQKLGRLDLIPTD